MKTSILFAATTILFASTASATTLLFDLGRTDTQSVGNWNNVVPATTILNSTVDSDGNAQAIGFEITDTFFQMGEPSILGSEAPSGDAAVYPVTATDDYFFGHSTPFAGDPPNLLGQVKLFNLDAASIYTFTFFASRTGVTDTRDALYTALGANSGSAALNASNNDTEVVRIFGITPDGSGEIFVDVEAGPNNDNGNGFYYIGLMQVDIRPVPEPSSALMLFAATLALVVRRPNRHA